MSPLTSCTVDERLDEYVARVEGISRSRAAAAVREGRVERNGVRVGKCSLKVQPHDRICLIESSRYVSRGGEKLAAALSAFSINPQGYRVLDLGISTGGFTDCLLQNKASSVVGVDVGHDQLAASLRADVRVTLYEGINARTLRQQLPAFIDDPFDLITVDLSFISVHLILAELVAFLKPGGCCILLLKPQFEVGRGRLGSGGIVRDHTLHDEVLHMLQARIFGYGLQMQKTIESPILGSCGNREFLILLGLAAGI